VLSLSQPVGHAILAMSCLERCGDGEWTLAKDLSACSGVPLPSLSKVLNILGQAGLVEAKRGYRGGFRMCRPAREVSLREVAVAVDAKMNEPRCFLGFAECSDERDCPAHQFWCAERAKIESYLETMTVADVGEFEWNRESWSYHLARARTTLPVVSDSRTGVATGSGPDHDTPAATPASASSRGRTDVARQDTPPAGTSADPRNRSQQD
jgi:Rrf2 family iron-sulfur cluster assembly transcriptional regulator